MKIVQLQSYRVYGTAYANHLEKDGVTIERFFLAEKPRVKFPSKKDIVKGETKGVFQILFHLGLFRNARVYSTGGQFAMMFVSRLFGWALGKGYHLYLHNFYLHSLGNNKWVQRVLRFLMNNSRLTLIAQTLGEIAFYRKLSDKINLQFIPYCSDVKSRPNNIPMRGGVYLYRRIYKQGLQYYDASCKIKAAA